MANIHFSFSDSLQAAVSSCLCCFQSSDPERDPAQDHDSSRNALISTMPPPRARPDELEGLLADSDSADAETLSLHSNLGDERRRRKRRRPRKGIKLFGFDLFGRPPIHLPESDDEDYGHGRRTRTISSSTLDSDAAPLDASALDEASVSRLAAATAAAEEEQRRAKEERRRLRRERKELKRMALAMAMGMHANAEQGEFEGFPGSGPPPPQYHSFSGPGSGTGSGSISATSSPFAEEFGAFEQGQSMHALYDDEAEADGADFGAESYARRKPHGASSGGTLSDSRSRTSGSHSDSGRYNHHYISQAPSSTVLSSEQAPKKPKRRSTRTKSLSSKQSDSASLPTSQSPSLPSPAADRASFVQPQVAIPVSGIGESEFEGFQGGTLDLAREHANSQPADGGFPSVGLRGVQRTKSDMGVFLARRGE